MKSEFFNGKMEFRYIQMYKFSYQSAVSVVSISRSFNIIPSLPYKEFLLNYKNLFFFRTQVIILIVSLCIGNLQRTFYKTTMLLWRFQKWLIQNNWFSFGNVFQKNSFCTCNFVLKKTQKQNRLIKSTFIQSSGSLSESKWTSLRSECILRRTLLHIHMFCIFTACISNLCIYFEITHKASLK